MQASAQAGRAMPDKPDDPKAMMMMVYLMVGVISSSGCIGERFLVARAEAEQAAELTLRMLAHMAPEPSGLDA